MKRSLVLATVMSLVLVVPIGAAGAEPTCATPIEGRAILNFGHTQQGRALFVYEGRRVPVAFTEGTPEFDGDEIVSIPFTFHFPQGDVEVTERATTSTEGNVVSFDSVITIDSGATGGWTWSGTTRIGTGIARIDTIDGTLCFPTPSSP